MRGTLILVVLAASIFAAGCSKSEHSVSVVDAGKEQVLELKKAVGLGNVYAISIQGHGYIDGKAKIMLMLKGKPYKTEPLVGKVNFVWGGDWYSDKAEIHYVPGEVSSGSITLEYKFKTL